MREDRKSKILEIISKNEIDTQNRLTDKLRAEGFNVTQATVSRDIKELGLVKAVKPSGRSCYTLPVAERTKGNRARTILMETVLDITSAENIVVVKTLSGCASAAAEVIDTSDYPEIVGTLAGDNTMLIIVDNKEDAAALVAKLKESIR